MLTEIQSAVTTISVITSLTKAVITAKVDSALREQAIETQFALVDLNTTLLALQSQHQTLLREKDELEKRLIEIQNWESEAAKYTLTNIVEGVFVYALKPNRKSAAPPHWLCPNCYDNKKKSILQFAYNRHDHNNIFNCAACSLRIVDHTNNAMPGK